MDNELELFYVEQLLSEILKDKTIFTCSVIQNFKMQIPLFLLLKENVKYFEKSSFFEME